MALFVPGEDKVENLSNVHFIKLALKDASRALLSSNFYWRSKKEWKYEELAGMKQGRLTGTVGELKDGKVTVDLENPTSGIVLMARLKVIDPCDRAAGQLRSFTPTITSHWLRTRRGAWISEIRQGNYLET
jgi:hypothetical protein